ncbi:dephospho-CoA kinase [Rhodanobacter sp. 115]|uniref:dephospho-CoA kinase n=1 Tax=Rhodanobacter sp. FW021-MT20 TaxID=1162282 RepID=UPI000260F042|nr:dephospho-CoA kinase [Rhodanobacter sp. 115]EIL97336.1 dephospho-CoA kinase [Rhodanobacter sp. 115]
MNATHRPVIALTGGIAAGKSTVEQRFRAHDICVYDADQAAREVIEPGTDGLAQIVEAFGPEVIGTDGRLDRPAMRQRIFADREARHTLESIVHPRVRLWLQQRALADTGPYCMLAIPLLAEHIGHYRWTDRVLLVDVDEATQIRRLMARDDIDETLAHRILANQATREQRLAVADDVIDNSGDPAMLDAQVAALHERYLALAANG